MPCQLWLRILGLVYFTGRIRSRWPKSVSLVLVRFVLPCEYTTGMSTSGRPSDTARDGESRWLATTGSQSTHFSRQFLWAAKSLHGGTQVNQVPTFIAIVVLFLSRISSPEVSQHSTLLMATLAAVSLPLAGVHSWKDSRNQLAHSLIQP